MNKFLIILNVLLGVSTASANFSCLTESGTASKFGGDWESHGRITKANIEVSGRNVHLEFAYDYRKSNGEKSYSEVFSERMSKINDFNFYKVERGNCAFSCLGPSSIEGYTVFNFQIIEDSLQVNEVFIHSRGVRLSKKQIVSKLNGSDYELHMNLNLNNCR